MKLALIVLFLNVFSLFGFSQVKPASSPEYIPSEVREAQETIRKILDESGRSFREGMLALKADRRSEASASFDKAVEVFLFSSIEIQRNGTLRGCYDQLIDTIYRIEFPLKSQYPQIRELSSECAWKWNKDDFLLADDVVKKVSVIGDLQTSLSTDDVRQLITRQNEAKKKLDLAQTNVEVAKAKLMSLVEKQKAGELLETELKIASSVHDRAFDQYAQALNALNSLSLEIKRASGIGFEKQSFEPSPRDALSKLELTPEELLVDSNSHSIISWQAISKRTGVSIAELMAANPGMKVPRGKVFVPTSSKKANDISYTSPFLADVPGPKIVTALAGDTVERIAIRNRANPIEVAKYNGLLVNSFLGAGREIKIPSPANSIILPKNIVLVPIPTSRPYSYLRPTPLAEAIGPKPASKNGRINIAITYFNEVLHDPYSMRVVRWSPLTKSAYAGKPCWRFSVKFRAKNLMGAYVLSEQVFYVKNNKILSTYELK